MTESPIFTKDHRTTAKIETPLGVASICDDRSFEKEWDHRWTNASVADVVFNVDEDRKNWPGHFIINGKRYEGRVEVHRSQAGGVYVTATSYGMELTDSARTKLAEILAPLVEPLLPRLDQDAIWAGFESKVRSRVISALGDAVHDAYKVLMDHDLTYVREFGERTEDDITRADQIASRVINEEVKRLPEVRNLREGFKY